MRRPSPQHLRVDSGFRCCRTLVVPSTGSFSRRNPPCLTYPLMTQSTHPPLCSRCSDTEMAMPPPDLMPSTTLLNRTSLHRWLHFRNSMRVLASSVAVLSVVPEVPYMLQLESNSSLHLQAARAVVWQLPPFLATGWMAARSRTSSVSILVTTCSFTSQIVAGMELLRCGKSLPNGPSDPSDCLTRFENGDSTIAFGCM